jgi:hypothetical protein
MGRSTLACLYSPRWRPLDDADVLPQHLGMEKQRAAERLLLRRCVHALFHGQPCEKRRHLRCTKLATAADQF